MRNHMTRSVGIALLAAAVALAGCSAPVKTPVPAPVEVPAANPKAVSIVRPAADLPAPIRRDAPQKVVVNLETLEVSGHLADGTTYTYWTFGGTVPGPMVRVRQGDTVELHLKNAPGSTQAHSIDLHAVNGPGGGAVGTQTPPGENRVITFQALNPGVYVYHCATPHIPTHVAMGMYGLIVVEPKEGLAPVDREFYVMQGEIYTDGKRGEKGNANYSGDKMQAEQPTYVVFNGQVGGLTGDQTLKAKVGEKVRIFVGNGGPNLISSFHIIGEIFDVVHREGASQVSNQVQTTLIPAGGATWVEFTLDVPGRYLLVDHALTRAIDKGAVAILEAEGAENEAIFHAPTKDAKGH